jgi:integrase
MSLTVKQVLNAKPGRLSDGGGLYLLTKPKPSDRAKGGAKSWVLRVQYKGRRRDFGLGSFSEKPSSPDYDLFPVEQRKMLTLDEARRKAEKGRGLAKMGISPSLHWASDDVEVPTFRVAATRYHGEVQKGWKNGKHSDQWLNTLETYAFPTLGERLVNEIEASDIQAVLLPIWLEKAETARRVRQRIATVLDYAHSQRWRDTEAPMRAVNAILKGVKQPKKGNFAAMPWEELPAFTTNLRAGEASVGRLALQFTILTAARSGEVRGAVWSEIDWESAEWRIPPERMKMGKLHIVPLIPAALAILEEMKGLLGVDPKAPIFPGLKGRPMSDATIAKALRVAGGGAYTVHGFRSTFRDWAADKGFADAWAEAALAHGVQDRTIAAYKRTTFYTQRREKLMPAWARYVLGDRSNIIQLTAAAG